MHAQALAFTASVQILAISAAKIRKLGIRWLVGLYHHRAGRQGEVVSNLCASYTYVSPQMPLRTHVHLVTGKKTTLLLHSTRRDLEKWDALITGSLVILRFSGRHLRKVFSTNHIRIDTSLLSLPLWNPVANSKLIFQTKRCCFH